MIEIVTLLYSYIMKTWSTSKEWTESTKC